MPDGPARAGGHRRKKGVDFIFLFTTRLKRCQPQNIRVGTRPTSPIDIFLESQEPGDMIIPTLFAPFSTLYVCGGLAFVVIPIALGSSLAVYLTTNVQPGSIGIADVTSAASATALVGVYFVLLGYMTCWRNYESCFSTFPWRNASEPSKKTVGKRAYQIKCPFTGQQRTPDFPLPLMPGLRTRCQLTFFTCTCAGLIPGLRCPSCQCRVHERAFHTKDRFIELPAGETVLRWDTAKLATQNADTTKGRIDLDEAVDFRGNIFSQAVSGCCIGCATWQKCFNMAPRLSLSLTLASMFFAYVPWAFSSFLLLIKEGGVVLKISSGALSVGLAAAGLTVQMKALGRANYFLVKHAATIPGLQPLCQVAQEGLRGRIQRALFATPWDPML